MELISSKTLKYLQAKQKELDDFIHGQNKLQLEKTFYLRKIALLVEIGELANELKSFKYWKKELKSDSDKAKEELIDCLHFFLSLANSSEVNLVELASYPWSNSIGWHGAFEKNDYNKLLLLLFQKTNQIKKPRDKFKKEEKFYKIYYHWLQSFYKLCEKLQIEEKNLLEIYDKKNVINRQRQLEKY